MQLAEDKKTLLILSVVAIVILVLVWYLLLSSTPGGPIIVIQPEENTETATETTTAQALSVAPTVTKTYDAKWFVGCIASGSSLPPAAQPNPGNDEIPVRFARTPGAEFVQLNWKTPPAGFSNPTRLKALELNVGAKANVLVVVHGKSGEVPFWQFNRQTLQGDSSVVLPKWPEGMFGKISSLVVVDQAGKKTDITAYLGDLRDIRIRYYRRVLTKTCS